MITLDADDIKLYQDGLDKWGEDLQTGMLMEECGECIVAVHHYKRQRIDAVKLLSEIADVINAMGQVVIILADEYGCKPNEVLKDLERQLKLSKEKLKEGINQK